MSQKVLLNSKEVNIILHRLACQLIENHNNFENTVLVGIQPRGKHLAYRISKILEEDYNIKSLKIGYLDITFFRDDFRRGDKPLSANTTEIGFVVENKNVVFIDDVLYTGRSIRAALTAIQS
ncbi:MAG: bifunctional pyr operon transcriptional regulator/uracil phosphoribosyltransferase PyrR, partial [Bacteroidia bacterium]|nr:bifunctional pyr operon transcriptional regulator/uracil phosphoribosyltransferase PyrR [Bacteroidia bacterium]